MINALFQNTHTKFCKNQDTLRWLKIALLLLYRRLPCFTVGKHVWMYVKDLVLGAKVDLKTSIIDIHGDFCYTKCGSGGSVVRLKKLTFQALNSK
jgi:hypothetical protein